jgi:hypothetical protein
MPMAKRDMAGCCSRIISTPFLSGSLSLAFHYIQGFKVPSEVNKLLFKTSLAAL